jgi:hypothetical protein
MVVLSADPWSPEYGMGFEVSVADLELPRADPFVETTDWTAPRIPPRRAHGPVCFVDGVRRVEVRLMAEEGGRRVPGLFGSYAVGSVHCDGAATFGEHRVGRALVLGGGISYPPVEVPCGAMPLFFEIAADARTDPNGPLDRLQLLMRDAEDALASHLLLGGSDLVLADGPLRLKEAVHGPVVGVVKRSQRQYLEPGQEALLARLAPGQRTPVFGLLDQAGVLHGYSWYARITRLRRPWHDHTGLVRCELRADHGLEGAVRLADRVTTLLPRYAGRIGDPRTPQNLAPVAGLETWLRHRMGDRAMVRRAVVAWLAGSNDREGERV